MVGIKRFSGYALAAALLAGFILLVSCEPLALRGLADKLAEGGAKHVYVADRDAKKIYRLEYDGTNRVELTALSGGTFPAMLAVDASNKRLFWTSIPIAAVQSVHSTNLDGMSFQTLFSDSGMTVLPRGLSVKSASGILYWAGIANTIIYRQNYLPGLAAPEELSMDASILNTYDVHYSPSLDCIYVADQAAFAIHRVTTAGTVEVTLDLSGVDHFPVMNIASDEVNGHIYWSEAIDMDNGNIWRGDTSLSSGSVMEFLSASIAGNPRQLAVDSDEKLLFWADTATGSLKRANLDGTDIRTIVSGLQNPRGVALDPVRR